MKYVESLEEIDLPQKHADFLRIFISRVSQLSSVERVVLFGSCAREHANNQSDIDIILIGDHITDQDECLIYFHCVPDWASGYYVENDVLTCTSSLYDKHKNEPGYVQRAIERDGVDLTYCLIRHRRKTLSPYENAEHWDKSARKVFDVGEYRTCVYCCILAIELYLKAILLLIEPNSQYAESHDVIGIYEGVHKKYPSTYNLGPIVRMCRKYNNEIRYPQSNADIYDRDFAEGFLGYVDKIKNYVDNECHISNGDLINRFKQREQ